MEDPAMELDSFALFDDADTLQAILDIVGDDGAHVADIETLDEAAVASSDDTSSTTSAEKVPQKPRRRKISGSTRMKNDVENMRASVTELTKELELLQQRRQTQRTASPTGATASANLPKIWKSVAQRQYRARREAEVANEKLRATVAEQRKMTQQILRALNRGTVKLSPENLPTNEDESRSSTHIQSIVDHDASIEGAKCERLFRQLEDMKLQVDSVLGDPDFQSSGDVAIKSECDQDGSIAVMDCRTVPFDSASVSDAIWSYYADRAAAPTKVSQKRDMDNDLMIKGFQMTLGTAFQLGVVEGVIVGRRVVSSDRTTILWAADVASAGNGVLSRMASSLSFQAFGWNIVSRVDRDHKPLSTVHMKHVVRPTRQNAGYVPFSGIVSGMLKKLVVAAVGEHQKTVHRHIDDALLAMPQGSSDYSAAGPEAGIASNPFSLLPGITLESW